LHALHTSRRRRGRLNADKEAPQRQQARECAMSDDQPIYHKKSPI
jgi:hypothetical protein